MGVACIKHNANILTDIDLFTYTLCMYDEKPCCTTPLQTFLVSSHIRNCDVFHNVAEAILLHHSVYGTHILIYIQKVNTSFVFIQFIISGKICNTADSLSHQPTMNHSRPSQR